MEKAVKEIQNESMSSKLFIDIILFIGGAVITYLSVILQPKVFLVYFIFGLILSLSGIFFYVKNIRIGEFSIVEMNCGLHALGQDPTNYKYVSRLKGFSKNFSFYSHVVGKFKSVGVVTISIIVCLSLWTLSIIQFPRPEKNVPYVGYYQCSGDSVITNRYLDYKYYVWLALNEDGTFYRYTQDVSLDANEEDYGKLVKIKGVGTWKEQDGKLILTNNPDWAICCSWENNITTYTLSDNRLYNEDNRYCWYYASRLVPTGESRLNRADIN